MKIKLKYIFSVVAGAVSALTVGYSLAAPVWGLLYADKVFATGGIVVMVLSTLLAVITGEKISKEFSQEEVHKSFMDGSVFKDEVSKETREEIIKSLPAKGRRSL